MAKRGASTGTRALQLLKQRNIPHTLHPYDHIPGNDAGYGLEAAAAIGAPAQQVFKTLLTVVHDTFVVGIVPVDRHLDLKALAATQGAKKATLADAATAERVTGYVVGGISPIGQRQQCPTVIDESAFAFDTIYVSAGRRGLDVELDPTDLRDITSAAVAAIATLD